MSISFDPYVSIQQFTSFIHLSPPAISRIMAIKNKNIGKAKTIANVHQKPIFLNRAIAAMAEMRQQIINN